MLALQSTTERASTRVVQRFYRVGDAAAMCGANRLTAERLVAEGQLPAVTIPSPRMDVARCIRRIPAVWLPLWLDMRGGRIPEDLPRLTPVVGEPLYLTVSEVAEALAVSKSTVYDLIRGGRFVSVVSSGSHMRIAACRLEPWCAELIRRAERDWSCRARFARAVAR